MAGRRDRDSGTDDGNTNTGGTTGTEEGTTIKESTHATGCDVRTDCSHEHSESDTQSEVLVSYNVKCCPHSVQELKKRMDAVLDELQNEYFVDTTAEAMDVSDGQILTTIKDVTVAASNYIQKCVTEQKEEKKKHKRSTWKLWDKVSTIHGERLNLYDSDDDILHSIKVTNKCSKDGCHCRKTCLNDDTHCPCIEKYFTALPCIDPEEDPNSALLSSLKSLPYSTSICCLVIHFLITTL